MQKPTEAEVRAEPAGARLNGWIAEVVMGWHAYTSTVYVPSECWQDAEGHIAFPAARWRPSKHWADAGAVLDRLAEKGWRARIFLPSARVPPVEGEHCLVRLNNERQSLDVRAAGRRGPHAIARAAVLARLAEEKDGG